MGKAQRLRSVPPPEPVTKIAFGKGANHLELGERRAMGHLNITQHIALGFSVLLQDVSHHTGMRMVMGLVAEHYPLRGVDI